MHFGIQIALLGDEYARPQNIVQLAEAAEQSGWEAVFVWDHLGFAWGAPSGDPWVILGAVAQATQRIKLGPAVTPLPRRRLQVLANSLAMLDILSEGRVIFGAGLGGVEVEFSAFGDPADARQRAASLEQGLDILDRLLGGDTVSHQSEAYQFHAVRLAPLPVQQPRIPFWIGGESRPAQRRAAAWQGWIAAADDQDGKMIKSPGALQEQVAAILAQRKPGADRFDVAISGTSSASDRALAGEYQSAGATWWLESIHGLRGPVEETLARVRAGPPRP